MQVQFYEKLGLQLVHDSIAVGKNSVLSPLVTESDYLGSVGEKNTRYRVAGYPGDNPVLRIRIRDPVPF